MTLVRFFGLPLALTTSFLCTGLTLAEDEPGSRDHPLIGRYEGASITYYKYAEFDEAALLRGPHDYAALLQADRLEDRSGEEWLGLEGAVTEIRYAIPEGRSSLEVFRNYEQALTGSGFQPIFSCADQACFTGDLDDPYLMGSLIDPANGISTAYFDHARYLLASRSGPEGTAYASILTGEHAGEVTAFVKVVEPEPLETGNISVISAREMEAALEAVGTINLYGILFDSADASLRPESRTTLDEVAALLSSNPEMRLEIIGHTDSVGGPDYNLDLSMRRAASVVAALTQDYGIAASRLSSSGAGLTAPVAPNDTEEGRAQNRRVELRAQ